MEISLCVELQLCKRRGCRRLRGCRWGLSHAEPPSGDNEMFSDCAVCMFKAMLREVEVENQMGRPLKIVKVNGSLGSAQINLVQP